MLQELADHRFSETVLLEKTDWVAGTVGGGDADMENGEWYLNTTLDGEGDYIGGWEMVSIVPVWPALVGERLPSWARSRWRTHVAPSSTDRELWNLGRGESGQSCRQYYWK